MEFSIARHITCRLSTERRLLRFRHMTLRTLFYVWELVTLHHTSLTSTITRTCNLQRHAYHKDMLHAILDRSNYFYEGMRSVDACLPWIYVSHCSLCTTEHPFDDKYFIYPSIKIIIQGLLSIFFEHPNSKTFQEPFQHFLSHPKVLHYQTNDVPSEMKHWSKAKRNGGSGQSFSTPLLALPALLEISPSSSRVSSLFFKLLPHTSKPCLYSTITICHFCRFTQLHPIHTVIHLHFLIYLETTDLFTLFAFVGD